MLKLYLAAHRAAAEFLEKNPDKTPAKEEFDAAKVNAFKAAEFKSKQDFMVFATYFDDSLLHMRNLQKLKMPS